jgi:peptidoglycan/xylan/chitin deacetylase (PgdA/CDA1 family)
LLAGGLLAVPFAGVCADQSAAPPDPFEYRDGGVVRGSRAQRQLAVVFTGHEFAEGGGAILDAFARRKAAASLFLTGDFLRQPEFAPLIRRMLAEGHYVGPHSDRHRLYCDWTPDRRTLVSRTEFEADLDGNFRELERFGVPRAWVGLFLPAYEHFDREILWSLPDDLLEFMRQQRCGYNPWTDAVCHQLDGRTAYGPRPAGTEIDVRGGWHDAADLLKYLLTSGNATAQLLLAWELHRNSRTQTPPPLFADRCNAGGQSGPNGIPDLLGEVRWGLEWLLKLHPTPSEL